MKDCRPGRSRGIRNAFDYDPHTLGSPTPPSLGPEAQTLSSTKRLLKWMEPRLWPLTSAGHRQAWLDTRASLKFLAVGGKTNKATDTLGNIKRSEAGPWSESQLIDLLKSDTQIGKANLLCIIKIAF